MIEKGWCRSNINKSIDRVRRMFKWASEQELIPPRIFHELKCVSGLKAGEEVVTAGHNKVDQGSKVIIDNSIALNRVDGPVLQ